MFIRYLSLKDAFMSSYRSKSERRRNFIGSQLNECKDLSGLYYILPFQKGYLVNWDTQRQVWDQMLKEVLKASPQEHKLIFTEPFFNFQSIQESLNEIFFEEYQFPSILVTHAATLSAIAQWKAHPERPCCLVIDSGYSFTHLAPYYHGKLVAEGVRRIDVGGKLLTNHLKEIVSYRQLNVIDETYVMNQVKTDMCYVSFDLSKDMEIARRKGPTNSILKEYILPDFTNLSKGYVREPGSGKSNHGDEQFLKLANERFSIPEILFNPSDIGIPQMGLAEAVIDSISATPHQMHAHLYNNVLLTGGSTSFPNFQQRMQSDVRKLAPDLYDVHVSLPSDPASFAWQGGKCVAMGESVESHLMPASLLEYREHGHSVCQRRFRDDQKWAAS